MDKKLSLKVVRTLTVPLSVQETLRRLYVLIEDGWDPDSSWDNFMEVSQTIMKGETSNTYLGLEINYVNDENLGE